MSKRKKKQPALLPKRAYSKPSVVSAIVAILFIAIILIEGPLTLSFFTNYASVQAIYMIICSPLIILGLFFSYYTGLAIGKMIIGKWHKSIFVAILAMVTVQIICIVLCILIEIAYLGHPIRLCFDVCQDVSLLTTIASYTLFVVLMFVPAFYALYLYRVWSSKPYYSSLWSA